MPIIKRLVAPVLELDELVRLHQVGFVAVWPLLGLASTAGWSAAPVGAILLIALFFNAYGVVLDDAVHLEVDRQDPLRTDRWLVRGVMTRHQAFVTAFVQVPLMVVTHFAFDMAPASLLWLFGAILGQGLYDVYGKRCPVPPMMEGAEAAAAFCLTAYGATVLDTGSHPLVWLTGAAGAAFILLVNAFHGSLRDIEVEIACGQHTTPIWLGCRGVERGRVHISTPMSVYAALCLGSLLALSLIIAATLGNQDGTSVPLVAAATASSVNTILFVALHQIRKPWWDIVMRLHAGLLIVPLMLAFASRLGALPTGVLFGVYLGPTLLTLYWWYDHGTSRVAAEA